MRAGDVGARRAVEQHQLLLLARDLLDRERHRRGAAVGHHVDAAGVVPLAHDAGADVGLVLMIGGDHLHRLAEHRACVLGRHARGRAGAFAGDVGIERGHVAEHADLDRRILRGGGPGGEREQSNGRGKFPEHGIPPVSGAPAALVQPVTSIR